MKTVPVDIPNALAPIALMISQPYLLVVTPGLPVNSVRELIAYAKNKPLAYELRSWYGLVAPRKTPPARVLTLNQAVTVVMTAPGVRERLAADGAEAAAANTPEQFGTVIANEIRRWDGFLKRAQLKLD